MLRVRGSVLVARMRHIVDQVLQRAESMSQDARITTVSDLPAVHIDRRPSTSVPREQFSSKYLVEVMDDKWRSDDFQPSSLQSADRMGIISQGSSAPLYAWPRVEDVLRYWELGDRCRRIRRPMSCATDCIQRYLSHIHIFG